METLNVGQITLILGCLVFGVNIITQMTKDLGVISKIPTKLYCLILSFVVTFITFACYVSYTNLELKLYYIISVIFASFCVSYIATYGFDSFKEIYKKCTSQSE